jgi:RimJ/RimL family protein N-acetyltransferase
MTSPSLQTARLVLRSYCVDDVPDLVRLAGAREVAATTLRIPHPYSEEDARNFISSRLAEPDPNAPETRFAITLRSSGQLCGGIGLCLESAHQHAELGYWLGVPFWGQGYATEAARAVVDYGFSTLGLHRIYASHFANNPASGRVLRKIGMKHEGCLRGHICKWGQFHDLEYYGMLKVDCLLA